MSEENSLSLKGKSTPVIAAELATAGIRFYVFILFVSLALLLANFYFYTLYEEQDKSRLAQTVELRVLAQQMEGNVFSAVLGDAAALQKLRKDKKQFTRRLATLAGEQSNRQFSAENSIRNKQLEELSASWQQVLEPLEIVLANKSLIFTMQKQNHEIAALIPELVKQLQELLRELISSKATLQQVTLVAQQINELEKLKNYVTLMLYQQRDASVGVSELDNTLAKVNTHFTILFANEGKQSVQAVMNEEARENLWTLISSFRAIYGEQAFFMQQARSWAEVKAAANEVYNSSQIVLLKATELMWAYSETMYLRFLGPVLAVLLASITLLLLIAIAYKYYSSSKSYQQYLQAQKDANRQGILQLQSELENLGKGNLLVKAKAASELTAPVAQSFNYTIAALRSIISPIHSTVNKVVSTAAISQQVSDELSVASQQQERSIGNVAKKISAVAKVMRQIAADISATDQLSKQLGQQVAGGEQSMKTLLSHIESLQDTITSSAKSLQSLTQHGSEVSDVSVLFNELAEKVKVLAVNATIHAGVTDAGNQALPTMTTEVQLLAEQAGCAAEKMASVATGIQTEAASTIHLLQQSRSEIKKEVRIATETDSCLQSIGKLAAQLSELIEEIAVAAEKQSLTAAELAKAMLDIEHMTTETSGGVTETSQAIKQLADYLHSLKRSLAGFKLQAQS